MGYKENLSVKIPRKVLDLYTFSWAYKHIGNDNDKHFYFLKDFKYIDSLGL